MLENNTSTVSVDIRHKNCADVAVVKTVCEEILSPGDCLRYMITVTNHGPDIAESVLVVDDIPSQMLHPGFKVDGGEIAAWEGSYLIGDMPPGSTVTIEIMGIIYLNSSGLLTNTVVVSSPTPDPDFTNNTSSVRSYLRLREKRNIEL